MGLTISRRWKTASAKRISSSRFRSCGSSRQRRVRSKRRALCLARGRRVGTAEGRITDGKQRLLAHGTTTRLRASFFTASGSAPYSVPRKASQVRSGTRLTKPTGALRARERALGLLPVDDARADLRGLTQSVAVAERFHRPKRPPVRCQGQGSPPAVTSPSHCERITTL